MRTETSQEREPYDTARRRRWRRQIPAGVVGVAAVSLVALAVSPVNAEPDTGAKPPHGKNPLPAPPQIRDLDFLLGSYTCDYTHPRAESRRC